MKIFHTAIRAIVPVLLLLASFTSRAQLFGNCSFSSTVDSLTNTVVFTSYPDTNLTATSYGWNFGDNTSGNSANPSHTYSQSGTYRVTLAINYSNGDSCYYTYSVNVNDTSTPCGIFVIIDTQNICTPNQIGASAQVSGGVPPYTYQWNNGSTSATICGLQPGVYVVTVTDNSGCTGTGTYYYSSPTYGCYFNSYVDSVTNVVNFISYPDTVHTVSSYSWYFGDNSTSALANPAHTYASTGTYYVTMYIQYTNGDSCLYGYSVSVHDTTRPCSMYVILDTLVNCGGIGQNGAMATPFSGTAPYTYAWSNGMNTSVVCGLPTGNYSVTVLDGNGCSATAYYYSGNQSGGCSFSQQYDPNTSTVTFYPYTDTSLTVSRFYWNFGDGTADTVRTPTHVYNNPSHRVTMYVYYTNGDSCFFNDSLYFNTNPYSGYCQAYFYQYIDSVDNNTFHFIDYSSYNPTTWNWDFGDGTSSNLQNPVHTYATQGNYTVCLTIADSSINGCTSVYCDSLSNVPVQDLQAYLYHQTTVTPGFPVWVYLGYYNTGTINMNGTLTYRYPVGTTITASSATIVSNDLVNRLATFSFTNLYPGSSNNIRIDLTADVNLAIGSMAEDTAWVNPISGDVTPADNIAFVNDTVTGSWDPNAKEVSPRGEGTEGIVPMATKEVSYMIHFQNTGNGPAHKVVVVDTLDSNIDWSTVSETQASHDHVTELNGNVLTVTFHNIMLPDSGTNQAGSQGFIVLHAKLKAALPSGTRITNTAAIYFDFNAPVMTNTVVTTLFDKGTGIEAIKAFDFAVVPNPASSVVTLRGDFSAGTTYEVINQLGQVMMNGELKNNSTNLNVSKLAGGVYLVKVLNGEKVGIQRLTITR